MIKKAILVLLITAAACNIARAAQVTLAWDPNDPSPEGYAMFQRTSGQAYDYNNPVWEGAGTTCTIEDLDPGTVYFFVVRAFEGEETSGDSNEVSYCANAQPAYYQVSSGSEGSGSIYPSGTIQVQPGDSITFYLNPEPGCRVVSFLVDGQEYGPDILQYTLSNIGSDRLIYAVFESVINDADNDGVPDEEDDFPNDPSETTDSDGDGIGDNADPDDDNDFVNDIYEIELAADPLDAESFPKIDRACYTNARIAFWDLVDDPRISYYGIVAFNGTYVITLAIIDSYNMGWPAGYTFFVAAFNSSRHIVYRSADISTNSGQILPPLTGLTAADGLLSWNPDFDGMYKVWYGETQGLLNQEQTTTNNYLDIPGKYATVVALNGSTEGELPKSNGETVVLFTGQPPQSIPGKVTGFWVEPTDNANYVYVRWQPITGAVYEAQYPDYPGYPLFGCPNNSFPTMVGINIRVRAIINGIPQVWSDVYQVPAAP